MKKPIHISRMLRGKGKWTPVVVRGPRVVYQAVYPEYIGVSVDRMERAIMRHKELHPDDPPN